MAHLCCRQLRMCRNVIFRFRENQIGKLVSSVSVLLTDNVSQTTTKPTPFGIKLSASYANTLCFAPDHVLSENQ